MHFFVRGGMFETQNYSMQSLSWHKLETIGYKLFIFGKSSSFQNLAAAVCLVVEQRMADGMYNCLYYNGIK